MSQRNFVFYGIRIKKKQQWHKENIWKRIINNIIKQNLFYYHYNYDNDERTV